MQNKCCLNLLPVLLLFWGCEKKSTNSMTEPSEYSAFGNPQRVTIQNYNDHAMEPFLTRDGRYLFFNNLNDPAVNTNLHYAERIDDVTFTYKGEIGGVNTPALEGVPTMDRHGNFYFVSPRSYDSTFSTIYKGSFSEGQISNVTLVQGISKQEAGMVNFDVEVSSEGNTLYTVDARFGMTGGPQTADLVMAERDGANFRRASNSADLMRNVNTSALEYAAGISSDGLELFLTRVESLASTPAVYRAARKDLQEPFGAPQKISSIQGFVEGATLSPDEKSLYYHKQEGGWFAIYRVTRQ